jgi:hypothetical protein
LREKEIIAKHFHKLTCNKKQQQQPHGKQQQNNNAKIRRNEPTMNIIPKNGTGEQNKYVCITKKSLLGGYIERTLSL